jgi:predicted CoA-binding protein
MSHMQGSLAKQSRTAAEKPPESGARSGLDALFVPDSVAVIGATERPGTVGRTVLSNLIESRFRSRVYAVNPSHSEVLGLKTYKGIGDVPEQVDLAVVVTRALTVAQVIGECVDAGVRAAVVISAGFREQGPEGAALKQQIQQQFRRGTMRLIGPNCLGIMNPAIGLNATFAKGTPSVGNVAFLSQSGALLTAILDWSQREEVGFSAIVSTGSMLDVGWGDLIDYFGDDPHTQASWFTWSRWAMRTRFFPPPEKHPSANPLSLLRLAVRRPLLAPRHRTQVPSQEVTKFWMRRFDAAASCGCTTLPTFSTWQKRSASNRDPKVRGSRS